MSAERTRLETLAMECAISTPKRKGATSASAGVPWPIILDIREEMTRLGYDVPAIIDQYRTIRNNREATDA